MFRVHPHLCGEYPPAMRAHGIAVHPHLCGEYAVLSSMTLASVGSPPPVWGIRHESARGRLRATVHPHLCGEYFCGSDIRTCCIRFTPTCVGNTSTIPVSPVPIPVHPHLCGEYCSSTSSPRSRGSPPPVWGIREQPDPSRWLRRFTPTCVGNTPIGQF